MSQFLRTILSATAITFGMSISNSALAAEKGTYRPGKPYASSPANSHQQCISQCSGDAGCKGWNFIRPNPAQKTGICEFNSRAVTPIASHISISANHGQIIDRSHHSQIIPTGTNTIRIGQPEPRELKNQAARITPKAVERRIIRQAPPRPLELQTAATQARTYQRPSLQSHNALMQQRLQNSAVARPTVAPFAPQLNTPPAPRQLPSNVVRSQDGLPPLHPELRPSQPKLLPLVKTEAKAKPIELAPPSLEPRNSAPLQDQFENAEAELRSSVSELNIGSLYGSLNDDVPTSKLTQPLSHSNDMDPSMPVVAASTNSSYRQSRLFRSSWRSLDVKFTD